MTRLLPFAVVLALIAVPAFLKAQSPDETAVEKASKEFPDSERFNVAMKTLGGRQVWGDVVHFHAWRIQQNVLTKHYRLLDGDDVRHAWGSREQCQAKLDEIKREQKLPRMSGRG